LLLRPDPVLLPDRRDPQLRLGLLLLRDAVPRAPALRLALPRRDPVPRVARLALRVPELRRDDVAARLPEDLRGLRDDFADDLRLGFSGMSTPARRASESPIAMACRAFFAPCSPSRILSISRWTNSPACVLADLPARLSARARSMVFLSGIDVSKSDEWNLARAIIVPDVNAR
jgi:hypothetical protein